jgi:molybdenum cofactor synthesis domain-containing protein
MGGKLDMSIKVAVLITSTAVYKGEEVSKCEEVIGELIEKDGHVVTFAQALPSDRAVIAEVLKRIADSNAADLILTIGGAGCGATDITPEATLDVIERQVPGIPESIRTLHSKQRLVLNRGVAGIRGSSLIVNLPKKEEGVRDCITRLFPQFVHAIAVIKGN